MKCALLTTLLIFVLTIAGKAQTSGAHFFSASGTVLSNGDLALTFDEAGLGAASVDYTASAAAEAFYGCINGGSNHPQASNKEAVNATTSISQPITPRHGRTIATMVLPVPPPPDTFSCPGGQIAVLASVTYTNATVSDNSNGVSISQADMTGTFSATFFTFKH